eukprot:557382-Pleurochrysis_carterae.AAC.1
MPNSNSLKTRTGRKAAVHAAFLTSQRVCDESAQGVRVAGTAPIRLKLIQLNAATATAMTAALGAHQGNAAVAAEMP